MKKLSKLLNFNIYHTLSGKKKTMHCYQNGGPYWKLRFLFINNLYNTSIPITIVCIVNHKILQNIIFNDEKFMKKFPDSVKLWQETCIMDIMKTSVPRRKLFCLIGLILTKT